MSVFEIVAGTYEEFLLGYIFNSTDLKLTQSFATHNHTSSIRCVATAGHYVASGSADDRLMIYDMKKRKEHCMLTHHNATVNAVQFTANGSHILSGSADGVLSILKTGNWKLEKVWEKAHKGDAILDIAVHSSGKLALTLGQDYALRTWNLVKGRQAYAINLTTKSKDFRSLEKICWCDDGVKFLIYGGRYTEVWSIETGGILKSVEHPSKVSSCVWISNESFISGHEDGTVNTVHVSDSTVGSFKAHDSRVKSVAKYSDYVITASSNGEIKVWSEDLEELAKTSSGCRITCLCILPVVEIKKEKEDIEEDEEHEVVNAYKGPSKVVIEVEDEDGNVKRMSKKKKKKKLDHSISGKHQDESQNKIDFKNGKKSRLEQKGHKHQNDMVETIIDYDTSQDVNVESIHENSDAVKRKKNKKKKKGLRDLDSMDLDESIDGSSVMLEESTDDLDCVKSRKRKAKSIEPIQDELKAEDKKKSSNFTFNFQQNGENSVRRKKKKSTSN